MTPFLFAVKLLFTLVTFPRCLVAGVLVDLALAHLAPCKPLFFRHVPTISKPLGYPRPPRIVSKPFFAIGVYVRIGQ